MLVSVNNSSELLNKVTGPNPKNPDTDATLAYAEEEKNYQNKVEAKDECDKYEDSDEDDVTLLGLHFL